MGTPIQPVNDATASLGTIHAVQQHRDAIHLAVEPVIAGEILTPGMHIGIRNGLAVEAEGNIKALGIVDPFLPHAVTHGEKFFLILFPRMITSLRHVWEHPDFAPLSAAAPVEEEPASPEEMHKMRLLLGDPMAKAKQHIMEIAENLNVDFSSLLEEAHQRADDGHHYWVEGGKFEGESIPDSFWDAYETYMGITVPSNNKGSFLSCSC